MTDSPAAIPILDWNGSAFLGFYLIALVIAVFWSQLRGKRALRKHGRAGVPDLVDPYEIAYLAAGPPRVAQLAIVRLLQQGLVTWKDTWFSPKIVCQQQGATKSLLEREILSAVHKKGASGLPVKNIPGVIHAQLRPLEARLAMLGYRPTSDERGTARFLAVMPLVFLMIFGCIKLALGLSRDKPVLFLIVLLAVTLIAAIVVARSVGKLTPTGEAFLQRSRLDHERRREESAPELEPLSNNVALFGTAALIGMPLFSDIRTDLDRHLSQAASSQAASGCSSGCGTTSSGCGGDSGGGGCGGCGGD